MADNGRVALVWKRSLLEETVRLDPRHVGALTRLASLAYERGDFLRYLGVEGRVLVIS